MDRRKIEIRDVTPALIAAKTVNHGRDEHEEKP
jgi:hypothetical protein